MMDGSSGPDPTMGPESSFDWLAFARYAWRKRRQMFIAGAAVGICAAITSLIVPEYYSSTTILLPEAEKSKLAGLGGVTDLAALAGINIGGEGGFVKLYPAIIRSESVLKSVIMRRYATSRFADSVNLIQYWEISDRTPDREYETALKKLREEIGIASDNRTSVVTMTLETREAQLSADILNSINDQLDTFIRTKRKTNAVEQRGWIESRLLEVKGDLEKAENAVRRFREQNRRVADSPNLLLEQDRLLREVQINGTLYIELKKQYEIAKIEEIKNLPIINVLDAAQPAAFRERPRRTVMTLVGGVLGVFLGLLWVFAEFRYPSVPSWIVARARNVYAARSRTAGGAS